MALCVLCIVIGAAILAFYVPEKIKAYSPKALILKVLVSTFFMATALCAAFTNGFNSFAALVIFGLLLGLLGDVWLDLKYVYRADDTVYTFAGFSVFAVGHIFFIAAMLINYADFSRPLYLILPVAISVFAGIGNVKLGPVLKYDYGKFSTITMVYGAILFSMTVISGSLALMHGWQVTTLNMMFVGGVFFCISDLVLSGTYFAGKERPVDIILNYITYYAAQFIIAMAIAFV